MNPLKTHPNCRKAVGSLLVLLGLLAGQAILAPDARAGTPAEGKHGEIDILNVGNSLFGIKVPYDVWVRRGERSGYPDSAASVTKLEATAHLFGTKYTAVDLQSKAKNYKGSSGPVRSYKAYYRNHLGDILDGNSAGTYSAGIPFYIKLAGRTQSVDVYGIPVRVGASLHKLDYLKRMTIGGGSSFVENDGEFLVRLRGSASAAVGVSGLCAGVEADLNFLDATARWNTVVSYKALLEDTAGIDLNAAIRIRLKVFVEALFWKKSKTLVDKRYGNFLGQTFTMPFVKATWW